METNENGMETGKINHQSLKQKPIFQEYHPRRSKLKLKWNHDISQVLLMINLRKFKAQIFASPLSDLNI